MRRRLVVVGLATTLLVVVSLVVPLGLLVKRQAADRARVAAEREVQTTAALVALAVNIGADVATIAGAIGPLEDGVIVVLPDNSVIGQERDGQGSLVAEAASEKATVTSVVEGGWELALPVIGVESVVVVDAFVTDAELNEGVLSAWLLLLALALFLIGLSVWVADRLGRQMVGPMKSLAGAAHLLGEGDLETRVDVENMRDVPDEIVEIGEAFNALATRLDRLLAEERESVADLSHRLRTPLTSLRLQAEGISDTEDRERTLAQVDKLEEAVSRLIGAARAATSSGPILSPLDEIARERAAFWGVLAAEEDRSFEVELDAGSSVLALPAEEIGVVIDTLIGNVFSHTSPGTPFRLSTGSADNQLWIELSDRGPGFESQAVIDRGMSTAGSTGLGLDIVRQAAEITGGWLEISDGPGGGAVVRVWFG